MWFRWSMRGTCVLRRRAHIRASSLPLHPRSSASMDASVPFKIRRAWEIIQERGLKTEIEADGGIRRDTVPLLHAAGADYIVPGSLMFKEDPLDMRRWLASL